LIISIRELPWRLGGIYFQRYSSNHDQNLSLHLPADIHIYFFEEMIEKQIYRRIVFSQKALLQIASTDPSGAHGSVDPTVKVYPLYRRTHDPESARNNTVLYLKGIQELYRVSFIEYAEPNKLNGPYLSVTGMATVLLRLVETLFRTGFLNRDHLPENYDEYLNTLAHYHLASPNAGDTIELIRYAESEIGLDDLNASEVTENALESLLCEPDSIHAQIEEAPVVSKDDVLSIIALSTPDGCIYGKAITYNLHPNLMIERGSFIPPMESGIEGISILDFANSEIVGAIEDGEAIYDEHFEDLLRVFNSSLSAPTDFVIDMISNPTLQRAGAAASTIVQILNDKLVYGTTTIQKIRVIRTETEEALVIVTTNSETVSYYFNLIALNLIASSLFTCIKTPFE
jgi:hypothetical protein